MKVSYVLICTLLLGFAGSAAADGMEASKTEQHTQGMHGMDDMKMNQDMYEMKGMQMDHHGSDMPMDKHKQGMQHTVQGTGVVEAIDTVKATVTIKHQAIPSLKWPAMTMAFKASPVSLLDGIKVGDKVDFTLQTDGRNSTVTAITASK